MNLISASICSVSSPEIEEETLAADCRGGRGDAGGVGGEGDDCYEVDPERLGN